MQIFLSVRPQEVREAAAAGQSLAHAAYRIGEDSGLLVQNLLVQTRGGLLSLRDDQAPVVSDPQALAASVIRQCVRRDHSGVALDFEQPLREDLEALAAELERRCSQTRRRLYLPRHYAHAAASAAVIVNTAVSGGSFETYLQETARELGAARRIALDVQRLGVRFTLPEGSGEGEALSLPRLSALMESLRPAVFFSRDLCAKYFTYTREGVSFFVLFDDAATLRQKLRIGRQTGVSAAFFQWPEIRDLAPELFRRE